MGIDVHALIVVGKKMSEMKDSVSDEEEDAGVEVELIHDGASENQICVGFTVADTPSWAMIKLDMDKILKKIKEEKANFKKLYGIEADVLLVPRMW